MRFPSTPLALQALALAVLALPSAATAANLITNGSFEEPAIGAPFHSFATPTGWTKSGSAGDASIWRIGYADGGGNVTVAGEGVQFVTMGGGFGGSGTTTWSQEVSGLTPGATYQLDFRIAGEGVCCGLQTVVVDFVGSATAPQSFTSAAASTNYWKLWTEHGMSLVADASAVTVRFSYTGRYDVGLDDVRLDVAVIPEPASVLLTALGLAAVGAAVRRRSA